MTPRFVAATILMEIAVASIFRVATFPSAQMETGTAQHQGSKSLHRISDIVPAYLHSPQRQRWLPGTWDMLRESSWKPCVKIIPEYSDDAIYCDAEVPPMQPGIIAICAHAILPSLWKLAIIH